jgi:maltose/moltooligosaccharide transporter
MKPRFPWGRTFVLGFGFLGISIIWPIFNQYVPLFLQAGNPEFVRQLQEEGREIPNIVGFALPPSLALFIMTWDNIINVFVQPWVGAKSDSTWNRFGRRKSWILLGAPIAALGFIFIPVAQTVLAIAAFILITNFGMALFRSPTVAWLGDLFEAEDRSKANGVINLMGGVGALLAFLVGGILFNQVGRAAPFVAGSLAMLAAMVVAVIFVREPRYLPGQSETDQQEQQSVLRSLREVWARPDRGALFVLASILLWFMGFSALDTSMSSFAVFSLGIAPGTASILASSVTIIFLIFAVPAGLLGTRFGRSRVIRVGLVGLTLAAAASFWLIRDEVTLVLTLVVVGALWAMVNVNSLPLVYDHGDEKRIGAYTGLYYFASQAAAVLGPVLAGSLVQVLGYEYRYIWPYTAVFMFVAWLVMLRVSDRAAAGGRSGPAAGDQEAAG